MADFDQTDRYPDLEESLIQRAVTLALTPIRILTSSTAIKAYLSTLLFLTTSTILLTISSTAYGFFYYNYIPQIDLERVLYLQYGSGVYPYALTELDTSALISQQAYDVALVLDMPRTPTNLDAGNFMLDLSLLGPSVNVKGLPNSVSSWLSNITAENVLHHSRRPAILPYNSLIVSLSHTFLHLPWHLINLRDLDSSRLVIPMFELLTFPRGTRNVPTHARLELQATSPLQVYSARLKFRAKFQGLRYLIYNYRLTAFIVFTTLFYSVSITTMALAWALVSSLLHSTNSEKPEEGSIKKEQIAGDSNIKNEQNSDQQKTFKTEEDTESSTAQALSGIPQSTFKTEAISSPVTYGEVADDENDSDHAQSWRGRSLEGDSGIGTSMESEHTRSGLVRRRSSKGLASR